MLDLLQRKTVVEVSEAVADSSGSSSSSSGLGEQFKARSVDFLPHLGEGPAHVGPAHLLLSLISLLLLWVFLFRGRIPPFPTSDSSQLCAGWLLCLVLHGCLALSWGYLWVCWWWNVLE